MPAARIHSIQSGRKHAFQDQRSTMRHAMGKIDFEHLNCRAADGSQPKQDRAVIAKVIAPDLLSRVKQQDNRSRDGIDAREIWAFMVVAGETGQCQIVLLREPPCVSLR